MMFLGQFHWSVSIRCLQFTQICYHHIIHIEFCVQNWPLNVLHNIYGTRHIGTLKDNWMPLDIRCHSGDFQGCLHVVTVMKVSIYKVCRNVNKSQKWMSPPLQALLLYKILQLQLNLYKSHTIETIYFIVKYLCHE